MKLKLVKKLAAFLCAILALTMLLPAALAANAPVTVSLSPVSGQKGEAVTVDVTISEKSNAGNGSMIVNYDPAKLEFVSFKGGAFGGLAEGGLYQENGKAVPGKVSIAFMASGTLQEKAVIGQVTFKILDDSGSIPLKLEMKELVAYTPDGTETDLMDTVKTENASVSIKARPHLQKLRLWHRWGCERDSAPADRCSGHRRKAARAAHGEDEAAPSPQAGAHRQAIRLRRLRL